jgi:hypothetical protein
MPFLGRMHGMRPKNGEKKSRPGPRPYSVLRQGQCLLHG